MSEDNAIGGWLGFAVAIYLAIGAIAVGGILVWPVVAAVAVYVVANKIGLGVTVIAAVIKAKLRKATAEEMIKDGLLAGGEEAALKMLVNFLESIW